MKKQLLVGIVLGMGGVALAQSNLSVAPGVTLQKINPAAEKMKVAYNERETFGGTYDAFESMVQALYLEKNPQAVDFATRMNANNRAFTSTAIGTTTYQNQTNASIQNRLVKHSDGTMSATWTYSNTAGWTERGTGYNYFNGTSWGTAPAARIENVRTGFVNVGVTGNGKEFVVSHAAYSATTPGTSTIIVSTRNAKGTGSWTSDSIGVKDTWPVFSVGGADNNTLHVISQTSGAGTTPVPYMGQNGAISYSRSTDAGATWDKKRTIIPEIDSTHYLGFAGNAYAMDAKGNTIAIVAGGLTNDVVLLKSTNNGDSWTKTIVYQFPIARYDYKEAITDVNTDGLADTIMSNDGSLAVVLDKDNKAHVFYGRMRVMCDSIGGLSTFPYTDGLMYWNENKAPNSAVLVAAMKDYNNDGEMNISTLGGSASRGMGTFSRSLTSFPSAGTDAAGNIYVSYASVFEGLNTESEGVDVYNTFGNGANVLVPFTLAGKSFRHTYVMRSIDGGNTWCYPLAMDVVNPSDGDYKEDMYAAMAKNVDTHVHMILQEDGKPGHGVASSGTPTDDQSGSGLPQILYIKIPVDDLSCVVGVDKNNDLENEVTLYPNPATDFATLTVNVEKAEKATVKVYNVVGQEVESLQKNLTTGINSIKLEIANYDSGIYFVSTIIDGKNYTQKLVVK